MKRPQCILVSALALTLTSTSVGAGQAACLRRLDAAFATITMQMHPVPEATAADIPLAVASLHDPADVGNWQNIAGYIGLLGYPESFPPLRDFIWNRFSGDLDVVVLSAVYATPATMGPTAASSSEALRFLIRATDPDYWKSLPWRDPKRPNRERNLAMSKASIYALGMSGTREAGQMLARLRQAPYREAQRGAIEDAIRTHQLVVREGGAREYVRRHWGPLPHWLTPASQEHPATHDSAALAAPSVGMAQAPDTFQVGLGLKWNLAKLPPSVRSRVHASARDLPPFPMDESQLRNPRSWPPTMAVEGVVCSLRVEDGEEGFLCLRYVGPPWGRGEREQGPRSWRGPRCCWNHEGRLFERSWHTPDSVQTIYALTSYWPSGEVLMCEWRNERLIRGPDPSPFELFEEFFARDGGLLACSYAKQDSAGGKESAYFWAGKQVEREEYKAKEREHYRRIYPGPPRK